MTHTLPLARFAKRTEYEPSSIYSWSIQPLFLLHSKYEFEWVTLELKKNTLLMKNWKKSSSKALNTLLYVISLWSKVKKQYLNWFFPYWPELPKRPEQPKQQNTCYNMWLIDKLYIKLGLSSFFINFFSWSATAYLPYGMTELEEKS